MKNRNNIKMIILVILIFTALGSHAVGKNNIIDVRAGYGIPVLSMEEHKGYHNEPIIATSGESKWLGLDIHLGRKPVVSFGYGKIFYYEDSQLIISVFDESGDYLGEEVISLIKLKVTVIPIIVNILGDIPLNKKCGFKFGAGLGNYKVKYDYETIYKGSFAILGTKYNYGDFKTKIGGQFIIDFYYYLNEKLSLNISGMIRRVEDQNLNGTDVNIGILWKLF
ncbi:MAG: hypothetical protein ABIH68_03655 [bacterium]